MKKSDVMLVVGIIGLALLWMGIQMLRPVADGAVLVVTVDHRVYGRFSLNVDQEIRVGETNVLRIENRTVRVVHATCPDQHCVLHAPVSRAGESIVCLPAKVVVSVEGGAAPDVDVVLTAFCVAGTVS